MKIDEAIEKLERTKVILPSVISMKHEPNGDDAYCLITKALALLKEAKEEQERLLDIIENYGSQLGRLGVTCQSKKDK